MTRRARLVAGAVVALAAVAVLVAVWWVRRDDVSFSSIVDAGGDTFEGCLLLADRPAEWRRGLMERRDLGGHDGMLFAFDDDQPRSFWMRNTPMPLSIAFYTADGSFVSSADMSPCGDRDDCPLTPSAGPARYAVEVPRGELDALGLVEGSTLRPGGSCDP
jgi:uncharacterized protein